MPRRHSSLVSDSWAQTLQVVSPAWQVTAQQPTLRCQSIASTTFEVVNFNTAFSFSDDNSEFDISSHLFN